MFKELFYEVGKGYFEMWGVGVTYKLLGLRRNENPYPASSGLITKASFPDCYLPSPELC